MEVAEGAIAFVGALAFIFTLRTEVDGWFFFYTLLFATCVAAVVMI